MGSHLFVANRQRKSENSDRFYFLGIPNHCGRWLQPWNWKMLAPWKASYDKPRQYMKKQRYHFANRGLCSQMYGFSSSHVPIWELDHNDCWVPKNWCLWNVVLEKTLESPLDCKEIQPVNPKGNQPWLFIGRTDAEELQNFGHLFQIADSLEKTLMLGKIEDRRRREWQKMRRLDGITDSMDSGLNKLGDRTGKDREAWRAAMHGVAKSQTWLSDWTATTTNQESLKFNFRSISSCLLVGLNHVCLYWIMKKTL